MHMKSLEGRIPRSARLSYTRSTAWQRLRESEVRFRTLAEASQAGVYIVLDRQYDYVNPAYAKMLGYTPEEMIHTFDIVDLAHREDRERAALNLGRRLGGGLDSVGTPYRLLHKDGSAVYVEALSRLVTIGGRWAMIGTVVDVTARVETEARLQQRTDDLALLNMLHESINQGQGLESIIPQLASEVKRLFECENATVYLVNEAGDQLEMAELSYSPSTLGRIESILHDRIPRVALPLELGGIHAEALRGGKPKLIQDPETIRRMMTEHAHHSPFRRLIPALVGALNITSVLLVPFVLEDQPVGLLSVSTLKALGEEELSRLEAIAGSISVAIMRKRTEDRMRRLNEELEERVRARTQALETANRELEAFSYSVSHDLRAPLRAIDGFSRILAEEHAAQLPAEGIRYLALVRDSTKRMGRLIDDLLAFARITRQPLATHPVDPDKVARAAVRELVAETGNGKAQVEIGTLPPATADPGLLKVVMINLLGNALKFTRHEPDPRVEVGSLQRSDQTVYFVRDNGVGFDMQ
ncbi:MAG: hypothetical protein A2V99_15590 [Spirochaetes bacterium RBG_16_67_19]|nr:MAG: hypothetical protein A2V99_15590 [Spirochaetes bacterium RBG_16_67_19]